MDEPVFDLFDQPQDPIIRPPSAKDVEANSIPKYHKLGGRSLCDDCAREHVAGKRKDISMASYQRVLMGNSLYLCYRHTQERRHRDGIK